MEIIIILNSMAFPILAYSVFQTWKAQKQLAISKKMFDDVAKVASEVSAKNAKALQDLADKVSALQIQQSRGMTVAR